MYQLVTLPNGARLATEEMPNVRTAAIGFYVAAGTRHEAPEASGYAHFIEHMLFKGTDTRSARQLAMDMDTIGGQFNAFTTKEHTCFYAHCLTEHLNQAIDILSGMLFHSTFTQENTEMERGVILEEINMSEDSPEDLVGDRLSASIFRGTPLAGHILGTRDSVLQTTGASLQAWYRSHYIPGAMVVALAGRFQPEHVERLRVLLEAMEPAPLFRSGPGACRPGIVTCRKEIAQTHLMLGFPSISCRDPRRPQHTMLNSLLGASASSRLFQELRERMGLCYNVYSTTNEYTDTGYLAICTSTSPDQEKAALEAIRTIILDLAEHGPTQEEMDRTRDHVKAGFVMGMESVAAHTGSMGSSLIFLGHLQNPDELVARIEAVTREQVRDLAQEIFHLDRATLSVVGTPAPEETYAAWLGHADVPAAV